MRRPVPGTPLTRRRTVLAGAGAAVAGLVIDTSAPAAMASPGGTPST